MTPTVAIAGGTRVGVADRVVGYWAGTLLALGGSLARGKIFALALGTSGVGVLAQLANLAALLTGIATLGLSGAGVTLIGRTRSDEDPEPRRRIASTIVVLPLAVSALLVGLSVGFARPLSQALLGTPHHELYVIGAAASVPANVVIGSYLVIMQGYDRAWRTAANSAITAVSMLAVVALLVVPFGIAGAVLSVAGTSVAAAVVVVARERWINAQVVPPRLAGRHVNRLLMRFGVASLVAGAATALVDLVLRSALVSTFGTSVNGLYQPVYLLGALVFAQLGAGVIAAVTPSLSAAWHAGDHMAVRHQINGAVRLSLLAMVPLILIATAARSFLVTAFFSNSFAAAAPVLALALTAEVPRCLAYAMGGFLLPAGLVRVWVSMGLVAEAVRLGVGLVLLRSGGANALAIGLVIDWSFMATATFVVARRHGIHLDRSLAPMVGAAVVVVAAGFAATRAPINQTVTSVAMSMTALVWAYTFTSHEERSLVVHQLRSWIAPGRR